MATTTLSHFFSTQFNSKTSQRFAGLQTCFEGFSKQPSSFMDEVEDDLDGEQETSALPSETDAVSGDVEGETYLTTFDKDGQSISNHGFVESKAMNSGLRSVIMGASKRVNKGTDKDYQCCDSVRLDGEEWPQSEICKGYVHAQKMCAAATFAFGHLFGKGHIPWAVSEMTGNMVGNPSVSELVSAYMEILGQLWDFNHHNENWNIKKYAPTHRSEKDSQFWGGPQFRRELHLAYTLAFTCLLQVDEVLKIQSHEIQLMPGDDLCLQLHKSYVPYTYLSQLEIQPFFLYALPEHLKHLCPVQAYVEWIKTTNITEGFIFRKIASNDCVSADLTIHMTSEQFLHGF
ncbi:hypothetical protein GYMLUDRAFT_64382 [Collybiopsis luxurians FD-317 M1]|uniref:Uncharacterized protein n=1 Tax=Collybiopsis luxurians FD-317 M1 TaxID=944289 RepID=A0A0D0BRA8_9AGAR|nr:hypothetical protein GYMLUDRAFT_64382 [Collybiopsis luxurians FD-317 M1]